MMTGSLHSWALYRRVWVGECVCERWDKVCSGYPGYDSWGQPLFWILVFASCTWTFFVWT